jgi:phospholipid/cholesterol/gamma-HCH transport system substrate-binding protein
MIGATATRRMLALGCSVVLTATGCAFQGLNSLPLPGAVGRGTDANIYHVEIANVGTLESNSPVMIDDVVVGSVGRMTVQGWHAAVEISVQPEVVIPANAVVNVGQTSLLGSMHLELNPPLGQPPTGRLQPGATIGLNQSSTYPSTEQTLSSLAAVVNGGGLGQIGDIVHNFNAALSGREDRIRDLIGRLDTFVGTLDQQRDNIIASIQELNRLAATFAQQRDIVTDALHKIPPALDVLIKDRPRITTALDKLRVFSDTTTRLINDTHADLVKNLHNLEPTIRALADIGPDLDTALAFATIYPYGQGTIDRAVRGDYMNLYAVLDLTVPRLKRALFLGTRWGEEGAALVPAPGDPWYLNYTYNPLGVGVDPPPADAAPAPQTAVPPAPADAGPMPSVTEPVLPVVPPLSAHSSPAAPGSSPLQVIAGPDPAQVTPPLGPGAPAPDLAPRDEGGR